MFLAGFWKEVKGGLWDAKVVGEKERCSEGWMDLKLCGTNLEHLPLIHSLVTVNSNKPSSMTLN